MGQNKRVSSSFSDVRLSQAEMPWAVDGYLCQAESSRNALFQCVVDLIPPSSKNGQKDGFCTGLEVVDGYLRQAGMQWHVKAMETISCPACKIKWTEVWQRYENKLHWKYEIGGHGWLPSPFVQRCVDGYLRQAWMVTSTMFSNVMDVYLRQAELDRRMAASSVSWMVTCLTLGL